MYKVTEDGNLDFNYEYLIVDIVSYRWHDKYSIQELYGNVEKGAKDGALSDEEHSKKIGGMFPSKGYDWLLEKYGVNIEHSDCPERVEIEYDPSWDPNAPENDKSSNQKRWERARQELIDKGVDVEDYKGSYWVPIENWEEMMKACQDLYPEKEINISISGHGFDLYYPNDVNGKPYLEDVGAHAMTITGLTKDGDLIVSSWGREYVIKKDDYDKFDEILVSCVE